MKVGLDTFSIRELSLNPYQTLDYAKGLGFEGVQFGGIQELSTEFDLGKLKDLCQYADCQQMYTEMSIDTCNPLLAAAAEEEHKDKISSLIRICSAAGWRELKTTMSFYDERYKHAIPWDTHLTRTANFIRSLRPLLEESGCRINIENHGETTFEVLRVVEEVGPDICGVCFDTANTLVNAEDPVLAAKRVAPYTHMTHVKDGILFFTENGISRQGKAPGQGIVDFAQIIAILGEYHPDLSLSIEDHKWIFEFNIFDRAWMDKNPDLTPFELGRFVKLAWMAEKKLAAQEMPNVDDYEAVPYLEQMEERLLFGIGHLMGLLRRIHFIGQ